MRETMSVTSSTQKKINKRSEKSKKSSRLRKTKLQISSDGAGDGFSIRKTEQIQKAIPLLAQAFANGFFTEVNCRILPENLLDQLAHQVYQFVQNQGYKTEEEEKKNISFFCLINR
jgi:hypothetical protein